MFGKLVSFALIRDTSRQEIFVNGCCWDTWMMADPVWLITACRLPRKWPITHPPKDVKARCRHLPFSAVASEKFERKSSATADASRLILSICCSSSSLRISIFHISAFRHYLSQKHFSQKTLRLNERHKKQRSKLFLLWTSIQLFINRGVWL